MAEREDIAALGPLRERFVVDPRDQLQLARLRAIVALLAVLCATSLLLSRVPLVIAAVALVGLLVPFAWLRQAKTARARAASPDDDALELYTEGLVLREVGPRGARVTVLRWTEVAHIDVDEERLEIAMKRTNGSVLRMEPRYPGVALDELVRRLSDARNEALRAVP